MADETHRNRFPGLLLCAFAWLVPLLSWGASDLTLAELKTSVAEKGRAILSLQLEGVVCASSARLGLVALQDETSTELLELPSLPEGIRPGNRLLIRGDNCVINRGALAIQIGTAPVVDLDGEHPSQSKSGFTYLREGMQPIKLEWFNRWQAGHLDIEYSREEMPRRKIPGEMLFRRETGKEDYQPGLDYASYVGEHWIGMPDFAVLKPENWGVVTDFDPQVRPRDDNFAVAYSGFLNVPATGRYEFFLTSDDGARLEVGNPDVECRIVATDSSREVATTSLAQALFVGAPAQWVVADGTVTFASIESGRLELELTENAASFHATVADPAELTAAALLQKRVQIAGVRRANGIVAVHATQVMVVADPPEKHGVLTKAAQIRRLQRDEASKPYRAEVEGVITIASPWHVVVQDVTGGVYIHFICSDTNCPQAGELWRIGGQTAPGDFSPVIYADQARFLGYAPLPKSVRPTREQLANGSLDAEQVEIEGVVTEVGDSRMKLLTREGVVTLVDDMFNRLPTLGMSAKERDAFIGSVVRLRGVYTATWDPATGRVRPAEVRLGNTHMSVDEPAPQDPFSASPIRASDLLLFTSQSSATKRVMVSGLLLHASPPQYLLFDGTRGFRIVCRDAPVLRPGDQVEAVGFPRLGGPSPVLLEAHARKAGVAVLPTPANISAGNLPDPRLDSTMVRIEGILVSDTVRSDERVLEMKSGANHFFALVPTDQAPSKPIERDSVLSLTGVYVSNQADAALANPDPFEMRLLGSSDIVVLQRGPWWTTRHTIALVSILSGGLILASIWVSLLRRTVAKRSRELALEIEAREAVERHRVMEQERTRVAQDLHDELGSGLTEAGILTSLVRNPAILHGQKDRYLEQLNEVCRTLVTGLDEIVWAVNPRYDSVADLAGYFSLFAQRFLGLAGINCRLKIDDVIPEHPLDSSMRHGIFLAFKEALNNIVRHSGATEVHLAIQAEDNILSITVADNGSGFDRQTASPGSDGLSGMESRMEQLGGSCHIETNPGRGTTVRLDVSLERKPT